MDIIRFPHRSVKFCSFCIVLLLVMFPFSIGCTGVVQDTNMKSVSSDSIVVKDSLNNTIEIPSKLKRIVVQNFDAVELLLALGAEDYIVGVPDNVLEDPEFQGKLKNAQSVGNWRTPSPEAILNLQPDAIIMLTSKTYNMDAILQLNTTIIYIDCYKIDSLPAEARLLGKVTGKESEAEEYIAYLEKYLELVSSRIPADGQINSSRIYAEKYNDYNPQGSGSGIDELIQKLNGNNIAADMEANTRVSPEWVVEQNPDIILKFVTSSTLQSGSSLEDTYNSVINRTGFENLNAVKNNQVYAIHGDPFFSPRVVVGLLYLAKIIYPDRFSDINPEDALREYGEKFVSGFENTETIYPKN
ncbi:periplasmic binding protein [Methanolacinia petrolearia DSM 11571]|uniref:Periplasmic binding protein n=2 Tax=Methanolacinia TaxID=230355 RepID=E1RI21_METP4|nr:periplasmic binding protein [Methanolacinia petrolearia DSM 11571]